MRAKGKEIQALKAWLTTVSKEQRWCVLINADPDAMGAAEALRRILSERTRLDVCRINEITRPDNLAMIRYLHLKVEPWSNDLREKYTHFAIVDSQPHHNAAFAGIPFSVIVDHHPLPREPFTNMPAPAYVDIRPAKSSTCTIFAEYLYGLHLRPSTSLATAMMLGIRTDTNLFERSGGQDDLEAYQWLSSRHDAMLLRRVVRSEYLIDWLPLFSRAFRSLRRCRTTGAHVWVGDVNNADLLVAIADFFTRVHGLKWIAVSGTVQRRLAVVIFRGDGSRDLGRLADACFYDVGSGGGHRSMARAEFQVSAIPNGEDCQDFIMRRLEVRKLRPKPAPPNARSQTNADHGKNSQKNEPLSLTP